MFLSTNILTSLFGYGSGPTHPYVAPLVYVTPTQGMGIQQSQYVDTSGMVYLPYISEWKQVREGGREGDVAL